MALGAAFAFAAANFCVSQTTRSGGDKGTVFSVLVTLVMSAGVWLAGGAGGIEGGDPLAGVLWFAVAGVAAMVLGRTLLFSSVRQLGVARSSAVKRLNPFFSVLLASLLLGEALTGGELAGVVLIALSFGLLIHEALSRSGDREARSIPAYGVGVAAALSYAFAYVARKYGLAAMDSPALGTFISALSGLLAFAVIACFSQRYRASFLGMFAFLDRWVVAASILMSAGQILFFAALAVAEVSTVAMIGSVEIFIAMFLSSVVFRSEPIPSLRVLVAAGFAMVGVIFVAIG
ncbi:DMT family transporter [Actibacterium sp. MT2.3-13A]|uniref:DMT family transporter n=1 Tax=Actibacterium sp. MT2.3-13A TaxID=2828332 RepID=UPI001BAB0AD8|nr:DMT family transporter [Actibacterium sp. MT2.3-13A]